MNKFLKLLLIILIFLSISAGCSLFDKKKTKWRPVKHKNQVFLHEVQWEDETYEMISEWYTGSKQNTELIINSNPALNPEKLKIGDKVFIPKKVIHIRKNYSRTYVENYNKKPVKKVISKQVKKERKVDKTTESFELFGPR